GPYGQAGGPYGQPQDVGTNQKAIWALVTGILGFCCGPIGIVAIFLGRSGREEIDQTGGRQGGRGLAQAGYILGIIAVVLWVLGLVVRFGLGLGDAGT